MADGLVFVCPLLTRDSCDIIFGIGIHSGKALERMTYFSKNEGKTEKGFLKYVD